MPMNVVTTTLKNECSQNEWEMRVGLAACYR